MRHYLVLIRRNKLFLFLFFLALIIAPLVFCTYFGYGGFRLPYHDAFKFDYPNRFFVSKSYHYGIIPLWDHWTNNGMPTALNISFMNFSPVIFLLGIFETYSIKTLIVEVFLLQIAALIGMFLWLKSYTNKWLALYGAFCFSLTPPILSTATNISVLTSMCMVPFVALGVRGVFSGSIRYVGILAFVLIIVFTSGYIGTNILYLPVIFAYCLCEEVIVNKSSFKKVAEGLLKICLAILLFVAATAFSWLELWFYTGMDLSFLRAAEYNPFSGGLGIKLLYTLFFVHNLPGFIPLGAIVPIAGNGYEMYFGTINLLLSAFAVITFNNLRRNLLIVSFIILIFCMSLSTEYVIPIIISKFYPLLLLTRWHGWFTLLLSFFCMTLAINGLTILLKKVTVTYLKILFILAAVLLAVMIASIIKIITKSSYEGDFFSLQLLAVAIVVIIPLYLLKQSNKKKYRSYLIVGSLVAISLLEFFPNSFNYVTYRDDTWNQNAHVEMKKIFEKNISKDFSYTKNLKVESNYQLITGIPSPFGYTPFSTKPMHELRSKLGDKKYMDLSKNIFKFNSSDLNSDNFTLKIIKYQPNTLDLILDTNVGGKITWANSYSSNWRLLINNKATSINKTSEGFSEFIVSENFSKIHLYYQPEYLNGSSVVMVTAYCIILFLILLPVVKIPFRLH